MLRHHGGKKHPIKVLLDTGYLIALINQWTTERLGIQHKQHKHPTRIENYTGKIIKGAGQFYMESMHIQHRKHYTMEGFIRSPIEPEIDIFLLFSWLTRHPPQGVWTLAEIWFNSTTCLEKCMKHKTEKFSATWCQDPALTTPCCSTGIVGSVS